MYIEKNGYVILDLRDFSFYSIDNSFSDDLESAEIFSTKESAEDIAKLHFHKENLAIVEYSKTVWLGNTVSSISDDGSLIDKEDNSMEKIKAFLTKKDKNIIDKKNEE